MSKERRLGRGLEALLGQLASRVGGSGGAAPGETAADHYRQPALDPTVATGLEHTGATNAAFPEEAAPLSPVTRVTEPARATDTPSAAAQVEEAAESHESSACAGEVRWLHVAAIADNPAQPREDFDPQAMQSLAESIAAHGLLQPVVVRRVEGRYELVAGHRRLRAAQRAGLTNVPVNLIEADDRAAAELAIIENLHRKDLNPLEKAASFQRYLEQYACTQEELAARLKIDRSTIANLIRLLELPTAVQESLRQGRITQGHARALLPLGDEQEQVQFAERIQREGWSVRQTEAAVQAAIEAADAEPLSLIDRDGQRRRPRAIRSEHLAALEQEFRTALGLKVQITHNARGRGRLVVHFRSHEEFERLRRHICDPGPPAAQGYVG